MDNKLHRIYLEINLNYFDSQWNRENLRTQDELNPTYKRIYYFCRVGWFSESKELIPIEDDSVDFVEGRKQKFCFI